ncbi:MAG: hypothetical protein JWM86_1098 [Thermoleophilia bacterium]|nr:hypothetical protein [Thermoleophilia bacterium]
MTARSLPFLIAHRDGNHPERIPAALDAGARLIEADVYRHRGRLEVRHLKTAGPLPVLWDTWELASPFRRRLQLAELLAAAEEHGAELMLDLKGRDRQLAVDVERALDLRVTPRPITICARNWRHLDRFQHRSDVRSVWSVGSRRGLRRLLALRAARQHPLGGVSIHERLLNPSTVRELRHAAEVIMTWPINSLDRAEALVQWGVHGLITDAPHVVADAVRPRRVAA